MICLNSRMTSRAWCCRIGWLFWVFWRLTNCTMTQYGICFALFKDWILPALLRKKNLQHQSVDKSMWKIPKKDGGISSLLAFPHVTMCQYSVHCTCTIVQSVQCSVYLLSNFLYPSLNTFCILNPGPKDQVLFLWVAIFNIFVMNIKNTALVSWKIYKYGSFNLPTMIYNL